MSTQILVSSELTGEDGMSDIAFHSAELWYSFGTLGRCWRPMQNHDFELSRKMAASWTGFMKCGMPGTDWNPCTSEHPEVFVFS